MKKIISYFLRGLIFITPFAVTLLLLFWLIEAINDTLKATPFHGPALVLFISLLIVAITALGYLGSSFVVKPFGAFLEKLLKKVPIVGFIYTSLKDVITAFVGEQRKFDKPVLIRVKADEVFYKPGFITQKDLTHLGLPGKVSVYMPHSYAFSGNMMIVDKAYVTPINISGAEMMKFIVSGGVADIQIKEKKEG